jgi:hypothetical protein
VSLSHALAADSLMATVVELTTVFPTRYTPSTYYEPAAASMRDQLAALGFDQVTLDPFICCGGLTRHNVVAIKLGTVRPNEIVLVGAHLDCTSEIPYTLAPGAEDNASGSAAVHELARVLAPLATERTIHFVLFGGEEQGLYGSAAYAARARQQNLNLVGVLILDMVGYYDPANYDLWLEGFHSGPSSMWLVDLVRQHAQTYAGLSVYVYPGDGWGSDHEPFHDQGYASMLSIENEWDTYPCYHRSCDLPSYMTSSFLRRIAVANATATLELALPVFALAGVQGRVDLVGTDDDSGATVTVLGTEYPAAVSAGDGSYALQDLVPGTYRLRAEHAGYEPMTVGDVALGSGAMVTLDFKLAPSLNAVDGDQAAAVGLTLGPAFPNPSHGVTTVTYSLPAGTSTPVWLRIVDAEGRIVRVLRTGEVEVGGAHGVHWDGCDAHGRKVGSGVFWAEFRASGRTSRLSIVRLR